MKKDKLIQMVFLAAMVMSTTACLDKLQVGNPNAPTFSGNVINEPGLTALASGVVYVNGFQNGDVWLGNSYFSMNYGFMELMADHVGADVANQNVSTMNVPDLATLSDGTTIPTQGRAIPLERTYNNRGATGAGYNYVYYQWLNAYALNNGANVVLAQIPTVKTISADKANTFRAWAYWWKGWAYAAVGSLYYSGIIVDKTTVGSAVTPTNNNYVSHDVIIAQSNKYYLKADSTLSAISSTSDYTEVLTNLIPPYFQSGHGNPPSVAEWKRNIQTMLARNILVNKLAPIGGAFGAPNLGAAIAKSTTTQMATADWTAVLNYANNGVGNTDNVFSGRSTVTNSVFSTTGGTVSANTSGSNASTLFRIGERLIQNFHNGDAFGTDSRLQNFTLNYNASATPTVYVNINFGTRWSLWKFTEASAPTLPAGTYQYANWNDGVYECFIGTSYEENELMKAEANIRLGNVDVGVASINNVRANMGAGITVLPTGMTATAAMAELVRERQVALLFRGLAFYDARRWGWIYDVSNGGGVSGVNFLNGSTLLSATINYNFLDYWDVPADEFVLNPPPGGDMTKVINPNFQ